MGGGVGKGVCGVAFTCCFAGWCDSQVDLKASFFLKVDGQKCL